MNGVPRIVAGSRKGSKVLIYNGYKYQRNKCKTASTFWRCWRKDCGSFIRTNNFDANDPNVNITVENVAYHGHDEDNEYIKRDQFKEKLREEINVNPTARSYKESLYRIGCK